MIVNDLNFERVILPPLEANAPPVVYTDAVLALPIALQRLQPVSRQGRERSKIGRGVKHVELSKGCSLDRPKPANRLPAEQALGVA